MVCGDWTWLGMLTVSLLSWPWVRTLDPFIWCTLVIRTRSCEAKRVCVVGGLGGSQRINHFSSLILAVKPRTLRKANLITTLAKNPMERKQGRIFRFYTWEGNPRELFQGKPTQLSKCPRRDFRTGVLEVKGKERYHCANPTTHHWASSIKDHLNHSYP